MNSKISRISLSRGASRIAAFATIILIAITFAKPFDASAATLLLASGQDSSSDYTAVSLPDNNDYFFNTTSGNLSVGYYGTGYTALALFTKSMPTDLSVFQNATLSITFQVFEGNSIFTNFNYALNGSDSSSTYVGINFSTFSNGAPIDTSFHTITLQLLNGALSSTGATFDGAALAVNTGGSVSVGGTLSLPDFSTTTMRVGDSYSQDYNTGINISNISLQTVPEPGSLPLILGGGAMILTVVYKRRQKISMGA